MFLLAACVASFRICVVDVRVCVCVCGGVEQPAKMSEVVLTDSPGGGRRESTTLPHIACLSSYHIIHKLHVAGNKVQGIQTILRYYVFRKVFISRVGPGVSGSEGPGDGQQGIHEGVPPERYWQIDKNRDIHI
jgi:hypothetical protein